MHHKAREILMYQFAGKTPFIRTWLTETVKLAKSRYHGLVLLLGLEGGKILSVSV